MSSLLDEAIVDAKALREAVLKNAEASLLEAYAPKIEEAVVKILEQDVGVPPLDMDAPPPMPGGDMGMGGLGTVDEPEETAAMFPEDEEEELDLPFSSLTELDDDSSVEDLEEIDITRGELKTMLEEITHDMEALEEDEDLDEFSPDQRLDEEDEEAIEISEKSIDEIVESLVVDISPQKSGWAGTPESVMQYNEELAAAQAQSDEQKERNDELLKVGKKLAESNKKYKAVNDKLMGAVGTLKEKLEEVNLTNAKLLYTNRVLRKSSLNERQKTKIVEALSSAGSVNEAKVLYETLQNAVGPSYKEGPKSLSEAVSRPSTMLPRRKVQDNSPSPFTDRMKILAGIKDK
jgi:hypothetical protein